MAPRAATALMNILNGEAMGIWSTTNQTRATIIRTTIIVIKGSIIYFQVL